MFIAALFTRAKTCQCPLTDDWVKEMWHIYKMEHSSAIEKNGVMPL